MSIKQFTFLGDSLTQGTWDGTSSISQGGKGCWVELVAERLANISSIGPLVSAGFRGIWKGISPYGKGGLEWSQSAGWTQVVTTNSFDKVPWGLGWYASGSTKTVSYTVPTQWRPIVGFAIDWIDYSGGGNWSYRVNGGAWTAMGQSLQNDDHYCRFYVSSAVQPGQTIDIRAADVSGSSVGCFPVGIHPFFMAPSTTDGLIVHNIAADGQTLHDLTLPHGSGSGGTTTAGDRMAILDSVRLGTGSPIASTSTIGASIMFINDVPDINNTSTWTTDLNTVHTRISALCTMGLLSPWEVDVALAPYADQASYRSQTKTSAAGYSPVVQVYDIFDAWNADGFGGQGAQNIALFNEGFIIKLFGSNAVHEGQLGHLDLAARLYGWIRAQFFSSYAGVPSFTVASTATTPTSYGGHIPAPTTYNAGLPNFIE